MRNPCLFLLVCVASLFGGIFLGAYLSTDDFKTVEDKLKEQQDTPESEVLTPEVVSSSLVQDPVPPQRSLNLSSLPSSPPLVDPFDLVGVEVPDFGKVLTFNWVISGRTTDTPISGHILVNGAFIPASHTGSLQWEGGGFIYFPQMIRSYRLAALDAAGSQRWSNLAAIMRNSDPDFSLEPAGFLNRWENVRPGITQDVMTISNDQKVH